MPRLGSAPLTSDLLVTPKQRTVAGKLIAETAKAMAAETYDMLAMQDRSGRFREQWPSERRFIRKWAPSFLEAARRSLIAVLASNASDEIKRPIYEELLLDKGLAEMGEHKRVKGI